MDISNFGQLQLLNFSQQDKEARAAIEILRKELDEDKFFFMCSYAIHSCASNPKFSDPPTMEIILDYIETTPKKLANFFQIIRDVGGEKYEEYRNSRLE